MAHETIDSPGYGLFPRAPGKKRDGESGARPIGRAVPAAIAQVAGEGVSAGMRPAMASLIAWASCCTVKGLRSRG